MKLTEKNKQVIVVSLTVLIIILFLVVSVFLMRGKKSTNAAGNDKDLADIIQKVTKLIELPVGETPTLATVSDTSQLLSQPFFAQALVGDKVLIYLKAKKAVLFRPSTNKIINVGPVNVNTQPTGDMQATPSEQTESTQPTVRIAVYNGTPQPGVATRYSQELNSKIPGGNFNVITMQNASKDDYVKSVVVDLTGKADAARLLATTFNGSIETLPPAEVAPTDADVLIILGSEYIGQAITPSIAPTNTQ